MAKFCFNKCFHWFCRFLGCKVIVSNLFEFLNVYFQTQWKRIYFTEFKTIHCSFFLFMCYHIWSFEFVIIIQFHLIPCNFVFKFKEISTRSNVCFMAFRKQLHSINHFSNAPFRVKIFLPLFISCISTRTF